MAARGTAGGTASVGTESVVSPGVGAADSITLPGAASVTVSTLARLGASITLPGAGGESVLANLNALDSLTIAGVGGVIVQLQIPMSTNANFAGVGGVVVQPQLQMLTSANFAGVGSEVVQPQLQMPTDASFAGVGTESVAQPGVNLQASAAFAGAGGASFLSQLGQSVVVNYTAAGLLSADATSVHGTTAWSASATFAGQGSLLAQPFSPPVVIVSLALVGTDNFTTIDPDDIMQSSTRLMYLKTLNPRLPAPMYFQAPHGLTFGVDQSAVSIGLADVVTSKGTFLAGQYLIYNLAIDQFYQQGVWRVHWDFSDQGAPFYSEAHP
jgi:hypothetical protein